MAKQLKEAAETVSGTLVIGSRTVALDVLLGDEDVAHGVRVAAEVGLGALLVALTIVHKYFV